MKKSFLKNKNIVMAFLFFMLFFPQNIFAASDNSGFQVKLNVISCNNNTVCEPGIGEDYENCPNDCSAPELPPTNDNSGGISGGSILQINNVEVYFDADNIRVSWDTSRPTLNKFYWGSTSNYESGTLSEASYLKDHSVKIVGLSPNTKYFYSIVALDKYGKEVFYSSYLVTAGVSDGYSLQNISNLKIRKIFKGIGFSWINPSIDNFSSVRIVRKEDNFSISPLDGFVVYEGGANSFDDHSYEDYKKYFYSFFVRDTDGNYSSGVFLPIRVDFFKTLDTTKDELLPGVDTEISGGVEINLSDISFRQGKSENSVEADTINISGSLPTEISFPANLLPDDSIVVLEIPYRYGEIDSMNTLLRLNKSGTYYVGQLPLLYYSGSYPFDIKIYNRRYKLVGITHGEFFVPSTKNFYFSGENGYLIFPIIILILSIIFVLQKLKKTF